jgi:hypothetical protein
MESTKSSDTSTANEFRVSGNHRRCPLVSLDKRQMDIGRLSWELPSLPISYWRGLQIDKLFVVDFPMEARLRVNLLGEVRRAVHDLSRIDRLENDISEITERIAEEPDSIGVQRTIVFKRKIMGADLIPEVPPTLERIEQALQFVLSLDES